MLPRLRRASLLSAVVLASVLVGLACAQLWERQGLTPRREGDLIPFEPAQSDKGAIGIDIRISTWATDHYPSCVYFTRVEEGKLLSRAGFPRADLITETRAYRFNVSPGQYVAIATCYYDCQGPGEGMCGHTVMLLPESTVESSRTDVVAGRLSFMGSFDLENEFFVTEPDDDEVQSHYRSHLGLDLLAATGREIEADTGDEVRDRFFGEAEADLRGSDLSSFLNVESSER